MIKKLHLKDNIKLEFYIDKIIKLIENKDLIVSYDKIQLGPDLRWPSKPIQHVLRYIIDIKSDTEFYNYKIFFNKYIKIEPQYEIEFNYDGKTFIIDDDQYKLSYYFNKIKSSNIEFELVNDFKNIISKIK